jgi:hypothetical protein
MVFDLDVRNAHRSDFDLSLRFAGRLMTIIVGLACILWVGASVYLVQSEAAGKPSGDDLRPGTDFAWVAPEMGGQQSIGLGDVNINIEAYNKKRAKDIAEESRKLVSLAQSLQLDLQLAPGSDLRPIQSARQMRFRSWHMI